MSHSNLTVTKSMFMSICYGTLDIVFTKNHYHITNNDTQVTAKIKVVMLECRRFPKLL